MAVVFMCALPAAAAELEYGKEWENYVKETTVSYTDVPDSHWAKDAIVTCTEKSWFGGYPDKSFRPNGTITRAEALKVFVVFLGLELKEVSESSFFDVDETKWYAPYIEAGKDLFPVHTNIQGKKPFMPDIPVTREDTIYALVRALGYDIGQSFVDESVLNMFKDKDSISQSMSKYFTIALNNGLVGGYPDSTIRAQASLSRAEFATLLLRGALKGKVDRDAGDSKTDCTVHNLIYHEATDDSVEYWSCIKCGKYYSDKNGNNQIYNVSSSKGDTCKLYFANLYDAVKKSGEKYDEYILRDKGKSFDLYVLDEPVREGYKFMGWYEASYTTEPLSSIAAASGDKTIYAKWDAVVYAIEYQNVPVYADSAQSKFPTGYNSGDEITLGVPTWPGRDFDCWEVVEGNVKNNKISRGTTGNIVLKAHWLSSENISVPVEDSIVSCIQDPTDGCYYFTYRIGRIEKIPVATTYTPKRAGNGVSVTLQLETAEEIEKEYGNTIAKSISTAVSMTESWKETCDWAVSLSKSFKSEISAGVKIPIKAVKLSASKKNSITIGKTITEEVGREVGGTTNNSYSQVGSSSSTVISTGKITNKAIETKTIPTYYPEGYYSYRTTVDADVYAVVKYNTNDGSYYLSTFSILGDAREILFYEESGIDGSSSRVNTKYNTIEYAIPTNKIEEFVAGQRYTLELDYNDETGKVDTMQVLVGKDVYLPLPANSDDGAFLGWEITKGNSTELYEGDAAVNIAANSGDKVTLKAKWAVCEVSYSLGCGGLLNTPLKDASYSGNNATIKYSASDYTYTFMNTSSTDPYVTIGSMAYLEKDKTYYVHMNISDSRSNAVQLFYAINGAYTEANSVRFSGNSIKTIKPAKSGYYNFRIDNDTGTTIVISDFWVSEVNLTAVSEKFNTCYDKLTAPTRVGYLFTGWYYNGERITNSTLITAGGDHTLVAAWTPDTSVKTSGSAGFYSRDIPVGKELNITNQELFNIGLNREALLANGYKKLSIKMEVHGWESWLFHDIKEKIVVYNRNGQDEYTHVGSPVLCCNIFGEDWQVRNYEFEVSLNALDDTGAIQIGYAGEDTANKNGTQTEWHLGTVVLEATAVK